MTAPELVAGTSGQSETNIRNLFTAATGDSDSGWPALIFIDEIDAIASKRENSQRGMERRIVAQVRAWSAHPCPSIIMRSYSFDNVGFRVV